MLIEPHFEYAEPLHRALARRGIGTVATYPGLRSLARSITLRPGMADASSNLLIDALSDPAGAAEALRSRFDVRCVLPDREPTLLPAATMAGRLGVPWARPEVLARFRDKASLKDHLRNQPGAPPVNLSHRVASLPEIEALRAANPEYAQFVLKPLSGWGNEDIGFFDSAAQRSQIAEYLARTTFPLVMEEFLDGTEYQVNGQVDGHGAVTVFSVVESLRSPANGRPNIPRIERPVDHGTQLFDELAAYTARIVEASGLTRSPFHAELIRTAAGPRLVEVAARLAGASYIPTLTHAHGPQFDAADIAVHYYLSDEDYGDLGLDWDHYNRTKWVYLYGVSNSAGQVMGVHGVTEVEAMPEFVRWVSLPRLHDRLEVTTDLHSKPYLALLSSDDAARTLDAAERARQLLRFDLGDDHPRTWRDRRRRYGALAARMPQMMRAMTRLRTGGPTA